MEIAKILSAEGRNAAARRTSAARQATRRMVNAARLHLRFSGKEFRAVFEMHGVEVVPITAPDEALFLENSHNLNRDAVSPPDLSSVVGNPTPVICKSGVDVDCRPVGMHRSGT